MSVTTLLIPVPEPVAEALLNGGAAARSALEDLVVQAKALRRRVAAVDRVREELHALLYPRWEAGQGPPGNPLSRFFGQFRKKEPARPSTGYDPFVHLFGRSLPVNAASPRLVAERLRALEAMTDAEAVRAIADDLDAMAPGAGSLLRETAAPEEPASLAAAFTTAGQAVHEAVDAPVDLRPAWDALARIFAWSQPIWRLDGETLGSLLSVLGVGVTAGRGAPLFEEWAGESPPRQALLATLPTALPQHAGAGAWLSSAEVKGLAGALRLQRAVIARNAAMAAHPSLVMRHLRLLEEAVCLAESTDCGLMEAAGLEWDGAATTGDARR